MREMAGATVRNDVQKGCKGTKAWRAGEFCKPRLRTYERDGRRGTTVKGHGVSKGAVLRGRGSPGQGYVLKAGQGRGRRGEKGLSNAALLWARVPGGRELEQRSPVSLWSLGRPEAVDVPVGQ